MFSQSLYSIDNWTGKWNQTLESNEKEFKGILELEWKNEQLIGNSVINYPNGKQNIMTLNNIIVQEDNKTINGNWSSKTIDKSSGEFRFKLINTKEFEGIYTNKDSNTEYTWNGFLIND